MDQLQRLAVLRRAQTNADRGLGVQADLRTIGNQNHGVRTAYVRLLGTTANGAAISLIPTQQFSDEAAGTSSDEISEALCVFYPARSPDAGLGGDYPCWTTSQLVRGLAIGRVAEDSREHVFGLVPDGVARVAIKLSDGTTITAAPSGNFFDTSLPPTSNPFALIEATRWFSPGGADIGPNP